MDQHYPHIVFGSLPHSGISGVHPVLLDIIRPLQYSVMIETAIPDDLVSRPPTFCGGHMPLKSVSHLLERPDVRFIYLYRDPRDVLISAVRGRIRGQWDESRTEKEIAQPIMHWLPPWLDDARQWLKVDDRLCFKCTFNEMKDDLPDLMARMLAYVGIPYELSALQDSLARNSFESVTGRRRGEDGPKLRTNYLWRKGISGEWKTFFDADITADFKQLCGEALIDMGFEANDRWGLPVSPQTLVTAPFTVGAEALIVMLRALGVGCIDRESQSCRLAYPADFNQPPESPSNLELLHETGLNHIHHPDRPTVIYVEEPRAALYAYYWRQLKDEMSFLDFLRRPADRTCLTGLPPADAWAYSIFVSRALFEARSPGEADTPLTTEARSSEQRMLIVRGEALYAEPIAEMQRILHFCGVRVPETEVAATLATTGHGNTNSSDAWQAACGPAERACLLGPAAAAAEQLGYQREPGDADAANYVRLLGMLPAPLAIELNRAQLQLATTRADMAREQLLQTLTICNDDPVAYAVILCFLTALNWTTTLFGAEKSSAATAQFVFNLLRDLNCRFMGYPGVQQALVQSLAGDNPLEQAPAYTRLGEALFVLGQVEGAESALLTARTLAPQSAVVYNDLAVLYWNRQQVSDAVEHLMQAVAIDPHNPDVVANATVMLRSAA